MLIKNGTLVTGSRQFISDIRIKNGKIAQIGCSLKPEKNERVYNAAMKYVMPGLIDAHTHYHLVSRGTVTCDSFEQGSRLAVYGGVTTVVDFADHNKGQSLQDSLDSRLNEMRGKMVIDYSLHQGVYGHGYSSDIPRQLEVLKKKGINTLKIFTTYRNTGYLIEKREELSDLFANAKRLGMLVTAHCEFNPLIEEISDNWKGDFSPASHALLRPAEAEAKAIEYIGSIALEQNCPVYIVHVSSEKGLEAIRKLREQGLTVYAETTPHYMFLDKSYLEGKDSSLYVMTPPLRDKSDNIALQKAVLDGEIQVVATDHCAFSRVQKLSSSDCRSIFPGIPGTEEMFMLLSKWAVENGLSFSDCVRLTSENPAKLFGLFPKKGCLEVGCDADIAIFDPSESFSLDDGNIHSASHYTPYRGFVTGGKFVMTIRRGDILMEDGKYFGYTGAGNFVEQSKITQVFVHGGLCGRLISKAVNAMKNSYSPYSHFPVGAAILTESGAIYSGCNVENFSYGGTICAERGAAMCAIAAEGKSKFKALAVVSESETPAPPCAICRQFLSEFASEDMPVYMFSTKSGVLVKKTFGELLPYSFSPDEYKTSK